MKRIFPHLVCALTSIAPLIAFAIGGEVIDLEKNPDAFLPSFCKLTHLRTHDRTHCTGTLIAAGLVVTAAHCVEADADRRNLQVQCGFEKNGAEFEPTFKSTVLQVKKDARYYSDESLGSSSETIMREASLDVAVLVLKYTTSLAPMDRVQSIEEASTKFFVVPETGTREPRLQEHAECRVAGFGQDTYFQPNRPSLAKIFVGSGEGYDLKLKWGSDLKTEGTFGVGLPYLWIEPTAEIKTGPKNYVMDGDSGGPLFCRQNDQSPWMLIAVSSRTFEPREAFDLVNENGKTRAKLNLNSGIFEMGFAPTFSADFKELVP